MFLMRIEEINVRPKLRAARLIDREGRRRLNTAVMSTVQQTANDSPRKCEPVDCQDARYSDWPTAGPLPLTPFEWYMFEGGQESSMTFNIRLSFSGMVEQDEFVTAVAEAIRRHPLLRAHVTGTNRKTLAWVPADDPLPSLKYSPLSEPVTYQHGEEIDLRKETGLRIWVRCDEQRTETHFQFHHACCDGIGAYRVLEDILCAYDIVVYGDASEAALRPLEPERLANRTQLNLDRPQKTHRQKRDLFHPFRAVSQFFTKLPEGLRSGRVQRLTPGNDETVSNFATHTFTAAETRALRKTTSRLNCSSNDLLMRDLFLAIDAWNHGQDAPNRTDMFRVMLPVTQRTPEEDELFPACNRVSMVKIDRDAASLDDPQNLLAGIHAEVREIRALRRDLTFHRVAAVVSHCLPLQWLMRRRSQRGYATTVLSQTGNVFARAKLSRSRGTVYTGGMALEAVDGAPPVNPFTPVSFATIWYAKKLTLTMSFARSRFTQEQADALLATYVRTIQSSLAEETKVEADLMPEAA